MSIYAVINEMRNGMTLLSTYQAHLKHLSYKKAGMEIKCRKRIG
jgi:hypothetical protein